MIYFAIVFFAVLIFLIAKNNEADCIKYLLAMLVAYVLALLSLIAYLAKDSYYYNVVSSYFILSKRTWKLLMLAPFSKAAIARTLNVSCALFLVFSSLFSTSLLARSGRFPASALRASAIGLAVVEVIVYDPGLYRAAYGRLYPETLSASAFGGIAGIIHAVTTWATVVILALSVLSFLRLYLQNAYMRLFKLNIICIGTCYALILVSYLGMLYGIPDFLLKVSKVADFSQFRSIHLSNNGAFYAIFPYYLIVSFVVLSYSVHLLSKTLSQIDSDKRSVIKQIDTANTSLRVLCHYIKNEVLAIQMELDSARPHGPGGERFDAIGARCDALYEKLNAFYSYTRTTEMVLAKADTRDIIKRTLEEMEADLKDCELSVELPDRPLPALLDACYLSQAVRNIVNNALDAMAGLPEDRRKLAVIVQSYARWIAITIEDSGVGISPENLEKIFTPFYSSKPLAKRWGIGLSLAYQIADAHGGKIEVESEEGAGTRLRILLPIPRSMRKSPREDKTSFRPLPDPAGW